MYRRYAGLFFSFCVDANDNELIWLEGIHLFVEVLGTFLLRLVILCARLLMPLRLQTPSSATSANWFVPLPHSLSRSHADLVLLQDLVFNFYKVYAILDEVFLAGEIEETSKEVILARLEFLEKEL